MTLWMLRRLLKFCLKKYIGPYVRGELDLDQFDFQLCSAAGLRDIALNVDEINAKVGEYPIQLKEGSIGRVNVTILPTLSIELDAVELRFIPRTGYKEQKPEVDSPESTSEVQLLESDTENVGPSGMGGYSYSPVQEGVRVVANLFERLFFGVHITVSHLFVAIEDRPNSRQIDNSSSNSQCLLLFRVRHAAYRASRSTGIEKDDRQAEEFSSFTSDISFQKLHVELVDIYGDGCEDPASVAGDSKAYGKPISIMQDDEGLSGHVKVSICTKAGSLDMPKMDADIGLGHIKLSFTAQQVQKILRLISSYIATNKWNVATAQHADSKDNIGVSSSDLFFAKKSSGIIATKEDASCKSSILNSQGVYSRSTLLPGAKLIVDWVHWSGGEKNTEGAVMSEEEFAASTEEFFDCLSGSGLWVWTCSALSAISTASSLTSGSVLLSQEFAKQVTYAIKAKIAGLSVSLNEGHSRDHYMESIITGIDFSLQVAHKSLKWQLCLKCIEGFEVQNQGLQDTMFDHEHDHSFSVEVVRSAAQSLQALVEKSVPKFPFSLCQGSQKGNGCAVQKKCFLRLLDHGHLAGVQVNARNNHSQSSGAKGSYKTQDVTEVSFSFQPVVFWVDTSIVCMLHQWVRIFEAPAINNERTLSSDTEFSFPTTKNLCLNMYFSKIRFWICSPCSLRRSFLRDHLLCIDLSCPSEKVRRPMVKLRISDSQNRHPCLGSATISLQESHIYLVFPSWCKTNNTSFEKSAALDFNACKVLSMSCEPATVEILFNGKSGGGIFLAERTWMGVVEQQKGGTGGRKTSSEFAAATATELMDENNRKIREDILRFSATCVLVAIPKVKIELLSSHHCVVVEIIMAILDVSSSLQISKREYLVDENRCQLSVSLDVGETEIILHRSLEIMSPICLESKMDNAWKSYTVNVNKLQMLYVVNLGTVKDATYCWLRHGNGSVRGLLADEVTEDMQQLLTCNNNALGRGDGGGGNALATKSAGMEVSIISWPGGSHAEDMLINVSLGGCTFMAHGGCLDWLPGLITAFSQNVRRDSFQHAIFERRSLSETETNVVRLDATNRRMEEEVSPTNNYVLFSLDLHDAALCYEPGKEAVSAANLSSRNTAEQFDPVACVIAAAAVRISSNAISNTTSKDYEIWLRDVALMLANTTLRRSIGLNYTPESLLQMGYVKVAGEAVMEAVVHINCEDGLEWELECANNQLRLDTCHDTTAALGRLIAQLQQLFAPEVEHPIINKSAEKDVASSSTKESPEQLLCNTSTGMSRSGSNTVKSKNAALFEEFLEDAFMFVRECPLYSVCNALDSESKAAQKAELVSDNVLRDSLSDEYTLDSMEVEDLRTPIAQREGLSFIEDYYISNKSSLQSSSMSSGCQDNDFSLQHSRSPSDDFDMLSATDGSGGWYDGPSFKVVENHVPTFTGKNTKLGSTNHKSNLLQPELRMPSLSLQYPQSVGRVIFRDLNFRWRLYGGSDWPIYKGNPASLSHCNQFTSGRQIGLCLEVIFHGVDLQYDTFPETGVYASRLGLSIRDVRIYDCSNDAPWKKILGYHRSKSRPRESSAKALSLELESVRPDPMLPLEEYRLSLKLLPVRLHLDQKHIDFFTKFFPVTPPSVQPHCGYEEISSSYSSFETRVTEGFEKVLLPFFQVFELQPFSIRVDYIPRHVDVGALRSGVYTELANLVSWKGIELELKHVKATGVHGWGTLSGIVVGEWLEDISQNQIHKLLKGLGPIRPLFAVGSAAAKLVVLPAEHYKRDRRRLLRGMRKGATAFLRSISLEAVGLGVQVAAGAHELLIQTESALGSVGLSSSLEVKVRRKVGQPGDMREGLQQACERLSQGLERTASSLIGNPLKAYHRTGTSTAVASALRAAPAAAVAPAAAAADALHRALLGVRNSLDPEHRRESEEKYSGPPPE